MPSKRFDACFLGIIFYLTINCCAQQVTQITAGGGHSLFLKSDGSLWAMGRNTSGQLGAGTYYYYSTNLPEKIVDSGVSSVHAGVTFSIFTKKDRSAWFTGINWAGSYSFVPGSTNRPAEVLASNVTAVAAGIVSGVTIAGRICSAAAQLFLKNDGSLWSMGNNTYGQLGDGTYDPTNHPEMIVSNNVTAAACGGGHSLFLKSDGSLWGMGANNSGQLGSDSFSQTNLPVTIVSSNVTAIACGGAHSLFLERDGSLWAIGYNADGQLGDGTTNNSLIPERIIESNVTAIAAGGNQSLFLKSDGSLWGMGANDSGQLGNGTTNNVLIPEQIASSGVAAVATGSGFEEGNLAGVGFVIISFSHTLFCKTDGSLWGMGNNMFGQLGDGTTNSALVPKQILGAFNQISSQPLSGGNVKLSFVGIAGTNYALERTLNLSQPHWLPQVTNRANPFGALVFTNSPDATANNFWRMRSVP